MSEKPPEGGSPVTWRTSTSSVTGEEDTYEPDETKSLDRFAVVEVRGLLALPRRTAVDFAVAFALGTWIAPGGARHILRDGQVAEASVITKRRRAHVIYVLGIDQHRWRARVRGWVRRWMAHECEGDKVCLFRRPSVSCPACHEMVKRTPNVRKTDSYRPPADARSTPNGLLTSDSEHETLLLKRLLPKTEETAQVGEEETASPSESSSSSSSSRVSLPVSVSQNVFAKSAVAPQKREGLAERANRERPARPWSKDRPAASPAELSRSPHAETVSHTADTVRP